MRIKRSVSINPDTLDIAQAKADLYFSGNLSMYINYLIMKDNQKTKDDYTEVKVKSEPSVSVDTNAINDILGDDY